jgi:hypothetical protein
MYPTAVGTSFVVQQQVAGTGRFFGADYGRARRTITNGDPDAEVRVCAKQYGAAANALTIEFIDRGTGSTVPATRVEQVGTAVRVYLRRIASGAPLATSAEVANAINAFSGFTSVPLAAIYGGTGAGTCTAQVPVALTGGKNPLGYPVSGAWSNTSTYPVDADVLFAGVLYRSLQAGNVGHSPDASPLWWLPMSAQDGVTFRWGKENTNFGLFHFEQAETLIIRQFEAVFEVPVGTHWVSLIRCPLNTAYEPVTAEGVTVFHYASLTSSSPDIAVSDVRILLPKNYAMLVITDVAMPGIVRLDARREANFPYL